jgi:hypothetical protein
LGNGPRCPPGITIIREIDNQITASALIGTYFMFLLKQRASGQGERYD